MCTSSVRGPRAVDLTAQTIGRLAVVRLVGGTGPSEQWLCHCSCGAEVVRCYRVLCEALRDGRQLACDSCRREVKPRSGKSSAHICGLCGSQSWRVEGRSCKRCGLSFALEAPVHAVVRQVDTSANGLYAERSGSW